MRRRSSFHLQELLFVPSIALFVSPALVTVPVVPRLFRAQYADETMSLEVFINEATHKVSQSISVLLP
jgi:hypothetical protein